MAQREGAMQSASMNHFNLFTGDVPEEMMVSSQAGATPSTYKGSLTWFFWGL
jgi:hypothetical protein